MKTTRYYIHSMPSTVGGVVAASAAIALLTRDALTTGFSLDHALMPVLVGLTVLAGHEAWRALKEVKLLSAVFMLALAVFGSVIIVGETMGRRAETRDAKIAQATKTVDQYAIIAADYQRTAKMVSEAEGWVAGECRSGNGPKCQGNRFVLAQRTASLEKLKGELETATAPAPVDSKADKLAYWASWLGAQKAVAKELVQNFDPFSVALFLELGAVSFFGFGVRHRKVTLATLADTKQTSFAFDPEALRLLHGDLPEGDPPKGGKRRKTDRLPVRLPANVVPIRKQTQSLASKHPVLFALEIAGKPMTNTELAEAMNVCGGESTKRRREVADLIDEWPSGKFVMIGLKAWKATA